VIIEVTSTNNQLSADYGNSRDFPMVLPVGLMISVVLWIGVTQLTISCFFAVAQAFSQGSTRTELVSK